MLDQSEPYISLMTVSVSFLQLKGNSNFEQATVFGLESEGYRGNFGKKNKN